jgi:uncharacterized low-complexity protein
MASKKTVLSLALASAVGSAFLAVPAAHSVGDPFAMQPLEKGYMVVAEMKDGNGNVVNKAKEAKCGGDKAKEAKCGGDKKKDGKCGEGKCGGDKAKEGKCGGDKKKEGKCGEGKCGGSK